MASLDESLMTLSSILCSRYVGPIQAQVEEWQNRLKLLQEIFDAWLTCQREWMYLEPIFSFLGTYIFSFVAFLNLCTFKILYTIWNLYVLLKPFIC